MAKNSITGLKAVSRAKIIIRSALFLIGAAVFALAGCSAAPDDELLGVSSGSGTSASGKITITKNPVSPKEPYPLFAAAAALSVEAQLSGCPEGVTPKYQWYKAEANTDPESIDGATDPQYTPLTGQIGTEVYFVLVSASDGSAAPQWSSPAMISVSDAELIINIFGGSLKDGAFLRNTTDNTTVNLTSIDPGWATYHLAEGTWTLEDYTPEGGALTLNPSNGTVEIKTGGMKLISAMATDSAGGRGTAVISVNDVTLPGNLELVSQGGVTLQVQGGGTYDDLEPGIWWLKGLPDDGEFVTSPPSAMVWVRAGATANIIVSAGDPDIDNDGYPSKWEREHSAEGFNPTVPNKPFGIDLSRAGAVPEGVTWTEDTKTYTVRNEGIARTYRVFKSDTNMQEANTLVIAERAESTLMLDTAGVTLSGGITVNNGAKLTLSSMGAVGDHLNVLIPSGANDTVTLDGANLVGGSPVRVASGGKLTLLLNKANVISAGADGAAGVNVPAGAELVIDSASAAGSANGELTVTGASNTRTGAGIGGNYQEAAGKITVRGGAISAQGGMGEFDDVTAVPGSAGIGGGGDDANAYTGTSAGGYIFVKGGQVSATGGFFSAGIGGGSFGGGGEINITGGAINATGGQGGAGIGGGFSGAGGTISISGGTINAAGNNKSAGIGGGCFGGGGAINISGGTISAAGGEGGAGIGGGQGGTGGNIGISRNAVVFAWTPQDSSSFGPAAIGGGGGGHCGIISISGGVVIPLTGTPEAASIGSGKGGGGAGSEINITGGAVIANSKIGGGVNVHDPVTISGKPVIFAAKVHGTSNAADDYIPGDPANGILANGEGAVAATGGAPTPATAGTITVSTPFTVPSGGVLTVPLGWTLDFGENALTNDGTIYGNWDGGGTIVGAQPQAGSRYGNITGEAAPVAIIFNANRADTGTAPASLDAVVGASITLPDGSGLSKSGYAPFGGWNTQANGQGTTYPASSSYTVTGEETLYALWTYDGSLNVGDTGPADGKVFWKNATGFEYEGITYHYLESAPADEGAKTIWSNHYGAITVDQIEIGKGISNTALMTASGFSYPAAEACVNKSINAGNGTTYDDWFLPSLNELEELYKIKAIVGNLQDAYYWSSSQANGDETFILNFNNDAQSDDELEWSNWVRAIRAF